MSELKERKAKKLQEGDFLVDLDNGYVYINPDVSEYQTEIYFHDSNGDECCLMVPNHFPLNVKRS